MPESAPLYSLLYHSHASRAVHEVTLTSLLRKARLHNQQAHLTGLLLFAKEQFLQVLEGPEPALSDLYARINDDPRHYDVHTLAYGLVEARTFAEWPMAYAPTDAAFIEKIIGTIPVPVAVGLTAPPSEKVNLLLRKFAQDHAPDQ
ncbi:BLUF domain-containing protein [Hymenobacter rubidus]|uniref:BLUF domain-containing protein n=1 Tax=Hymenobacter rubidus TaxID=1441626 RepID=UPI00191F4C2A|nr:BLUF domain-containing protein [Hymenobacter rubidus]